MQFLKQTNFDFLGLGKICLTVSALLVAGSIALVAGGRLRYGVEFDSGTQLIAHFENTPDIDKVRSAVEKTSPGAVIQTFGQASDNQVLIRTGLVESPDGDLSVGVQNVLKSLADNYTENKITDSSTEIVGPTVGAELRHKAIVLTVLGLLFQLVYIWWRFKGPVWGSAAAIAVLHDVLITLGLLALFGYEITLNVIAALLTLVGYSVNDTIVLFDRVRENLRQRRKDPLPKIINDSVNQTLSRTLISNGTTFLTVFGLYLAGGEVLKGFAFAMVMGVVIGTYSTIYIASPIVVWWHKARGGQRGDSVSGQIKAAL